MAVSPTDEVEWLPRTSGVGAAVIGGAVLGAYVVLTLVDRPTRADVAPLLLSLTLALLAWVVLVRPRVGITAEALVLQGMVSRLAVPWSRVDDVAIRHALLVFTPERRYVSPALSRRRRSFLARNPDRAELAVADHLVERLRDRAREAAEQAGDELPPVHRDWDQPVLALVVASLLVSVAAALW